MRRVIIDKRDGEEQGNAHGRDYAPVSRNGATPESADNHRVRERGAENKSGTFS
jgi:hypothetical protein